ncbi:MAG: metallophosphoesterase family protein [Anaerolineae bacterium]
MRVALIADIHGNLPALEAALAEIAAERVDEVVCLGDVAAFGPQPRAVLARLRTLNGPVVMGNTDAWLLDPQPHPYRDEDTARVYEVERWCAAQLEPADLDYVRTFRPTVTVPLGDDDTLLCYHGSPRSNMDSIFAATPDDALAPMLAGHRATALAGGHTHTPMVRRYRASLLVNPGSVGLPFTDTVRGEARNPAWAEYALLTRTPGRLDAALRRVSYPVDAIIDAAFASGMPHVEWWTKGWNQA